MPRFLGELSRPTCEDSCSAVCREIGLGCQLSGGGKGFRCTERRDELSYVWPGECDVSACWVSTVMGGDRVNYRIFLDTNVDAFLRCSQDRGGERRV